MTFSPLHLRFALATLAALTGRHFVDLYASLPGRAKWGDHVLAGLRMLPPQVQTQLYEETTDLRATHWTAAVAALGASRDIPEHWPPGLYGALKMEFQVIERFSDSIEYDVVKLAKRVQHAEGLKQRLLEEPHLWPLDDHMRGQDGDGETINGDDDEKAKDGKHVP